MYYCLSTCLLTQVANSSVSGAASVPLIRVSLLSVGGGAQTMESMQQSADA